MRTTILAVIVLAFSVNQALAVSRAVKLACASDYFAHCSMHPVGSPGVRKCMRDVGPNLSSQCIGALIAAGEVGGSKAVAKKKIYAKATGPKTKTYAKATVAKKQYAKKLTAKKYASKRYDSKKKYAKSYSKKRYVEKPSKKEYARYAARDY